MDDIASSLAGAGQSADDVFVGGYELPCAFLTENCGTTLVELVQRPVSTA
ncbi:hypothetical protein NKH77_47070 [Streptomyces sp. M19]